MPTTTTLADILSRMDRWDSILAEEEQFKVRDLDEAMRMLRRDTVLPWTLQQTTLRVFDDVLEYPVASDHDELAFFDNDKKVFGDKPRFRFTSIKEFYEDPDYRNDLAEIWDNNDRHLGVRYKCRNTSDVKLNNAETIGDWTASGDADSVAAETVMYKEGNGSVKVVVTSSSGTATIKNNLTSNQNDTVYKRKYHFKWVYLDVVPDSISMRYHIDSSNYLETTGITTQFSGQALKADEFNLIAHDLNSATPNGTIGTSPTFTYEEIDLVGSSISGTYYIDASYAREWELLDYWYYSKNMVATVGQTTANQEYFFNSSGVYSTDSMLVGDSEWADLIMYDALLRAATNKENKILVDRFNADKQRALSSLQDKYPDMVPIITTSKWRFDTTPGRHTYSYGKYTY